MQTVGARLRWARERRLLSQEDLSRTAKVTEATISRMENDRSGPPRPSTVRKLASELGINPRWLLFGEGRAEAPAAPAGLYEVGADDPGGKVAA